MRSTWGLVPTIKKGKDRKGIRIETKMFLQMKNDIDTASASNKDISMTTCSNIENRIDKANASNILNDLADLA
ncbi:unnamed protein product [Dovyalis caffra]|uniref:Uncharacterized protein n=1 Tax=Dovyalis caffra TaxID=77055 RepID=A0AAV1SC14_9ROSI|nr:unnamed protein product [Dovyalis caffra]